MTYQPHQSEDGTLKPVAPNNSGDASPGGMTDERIRHLWLHRPFDGIAGGDILTQINWFARAIEKEARSSGVDAKWVDKAMELADDYAALRRQSGESHEAVDAQECRNTRTALRHHLESSCGSTGGVAVVSPGADAQRNKGAA